MPVLPLMLLYAFIGGLILNIMPCVLPVIALKILGFVGESRSDPRHVRKLGLVYALGVLVSFAALAAVVIGVKAAGHRAGWGMQFGSPIFVVCLTTLVTLVALNLFGVFEVTLGGRALDAAGELASKHGSAGAFFNGVLATMLATPCTAPFLEHRPRLRLCANSAGDFVDVSRRRRGSGRAVRRAELESGLVEISAQTRRVDGKIQDRHGLSDAGDCRVAVQSRRRQLRQDRLVAGRFSGGRRVCRMDFRRIRPAGPRPQRTGFCDCADIAGRRLRLRVGKPVTLARAGHGYGCDRFAASNRQTELPGSAGVRKPWRKRAAKAGRCWWILPPIGA